MNFLITIAYLFTSIIVALFLYYFSSIFKKLGIASIDEINEEEENDDDRVDESETKIINYFGTITFLILGTIIWSLLGITIGKIASNITEHTILKWLVYVFMYFFCLRIPFGMGNKMVKRSYNLTS